MDAQETEATLERWTVESVVHENNGRTPDAASFFISGLAPSFQMMRASGQMTDRKGFCAALTSGGNLQLVGNPQVDMLGERRAVVRCVIEVNGKQYDNLLVHLLDITTGQWHVHLWANEEVKEPANE